MEWRGRHRREEVGWVARAVSESLYAFVKTQSAEELALRGRPVAFDFFLDAVEKDRFYKQELVGWLKSLRHTSRMNCHPQQKMRP